MIHSMPIPHSSTIASLNLMAQVQESLTSLPWPLPRRFFEHHRPFTLHIYPYPLGGSTPPPPLPPAPPAFRQTSGSNMSTSSMYHHQSSHHHHGHHHHHHAHQPSSQGPDEAEDGSLLEVLWGRPLRISIAGFFRGLDADVCHRSLHRMKITAVTTDEHDRRVGR